MDKLTPQDFKEVNKLYRKLIQAQAEGATSLEIYPQEIAHLKCITFSDASFAAEPGCRHQAGFITAVTGGEAAGASLQASMLEFQPSAIHWVVKSTLAAEAASLSTAVNRQLYTRLV